MNFIKWIPVIGQAISGIAFVVQKVKARRKARFTEAQRLQAEQEAKDRLDKILAGVDAAKGK